MQVTSESDGGGIFAFPEGNDGIAEDSDDKGTAEGCPRCNVPTGGESSEVPVLGESCTGVPPAEESRPVPTEPTPGVNGDAVR